jgi:Mg-chelatase subunit ChlI
MKAEAAFFDMKLRALNDLATALVCGSVDQMKAVTEDRKNAEVGCIR